MVPQLTWGWCFIVVIWVSHSITTLTNFLDDNLKIQFFRDYCRNYLFHLIKLMQDALLFDVITAMMIKPVKHFSRFDHGLAPAWRTSFSNCCSHPVMLFLHRFLPLSQASRILNLLLSRIEKYICLMKWKSALIMETVNNDNRRQLWCK